MHNVMRDIEVCGGWHSPASCTLAANSTLWCIWHFGIL